MNFLHIHFPGIHATQSNMLLLKVLCRIMYVSRKFSAAYHHQITAELPHSLVHSQLQNMLNRQHCNIEVTVNGNITRWPLQLAPPKLTETA